MIYKPKNFIMKEVATLKDLMIYQLQSLQEAEDVWSQALRENTPFIANDELKKLFEKGSNTALQHADKITKLLKELGTTVLTRRNIVAYDLVRELKEIQENSLDTEVLDAGLIVTHQCMNHYMIAKYGSVASYARLMEKENLAAALHKILEEKKNEDAYLSQLAETSINTKAKTALIH
jgi:ferritin-like metal-binding protein YciE